MNDPEPTRDEVPKALEVIPSVMILVVLGWIALALVELEYVISGGAKPHWVLEAPFTMLFVTGIALFLAILPIGRERPAPEWEAEAWVCKHCLRPFVPGAHFCPRCSCPQTFFSGTAGYEQIYAKMWCLGKAAHHPSRVIHLMVLVGAGAGAVFSYVLSLSYTKLDGDPLPLEVLGLVLGLVVQTLGVWIWMRFAWLAVKNWRRRKRGEATPEIEYGHPPWWTYDAEWALPEVIEDDQPEGPPPPPTEPSAG